MSVAQRDLICPDCRSHHRGRCGRYSAQHVELLTDGQFYSELEGTLKDAEELENLSWVRGRSVIEETGQVDSALFTGILDLERAMAALSRRHSLGALIVMARMSDISTDKLEQVLRWHRMDIERIERQSKAFLAAWLSGEDPDAAWRRAGHKRVGRDLNRTVGGQKLN